MSNPRSRRSFLAATAVVALGGCVGGSDESEDDGNGAGDGTVTPDEESTATPEATPTATETSTQESPEEMVDRLPEDHPLSDTLVDLILADDRATFAEERDLSFRDGAVLVDITLVDKNNSLPEKYLSEERSEYGDRVIAYVDVNQLVDLALNDNVKRITRRFQPKPGDGM